MVAPGGSSSVEGGTIAQLALAVHGGAGAHTRERSTPERDRARREVLRDSLVAGFACLQGGSPALDDGRHVLLAGPDADAFARERGVERIDPAELVAAAEQCAQRDATGTVGAVARDAEGHLAVATSTRGRPGTPSSSATRRSSGWRSPTCSRRCATARPSSS